MRPRRRGTGVRITAPAHACWLDSRGSRRGPDSDQPTPRREDMSQAIAYTSTPKRSAASDLALRALRRQVQGAVIEPNADGWDQATQAFNLTVRQEPALVALPENEQDV